MATLSDEPIDPGILPYFKRKVSDGSRHFECGCFWQYHIEPAKEEHIYRYCDTHIDDHDGMFKQLQDGLTLST